MKKGFIKIGHKYFFDGREMPGVTTINKYSMSPEGRERINRWIASTTAKAAKRGKKDPAKAWVEERDDAGAKGRGLHRYLALYARTGRVSSHMPLKYHLQFFLAASWLLKVQANVVRVEKPVYSIQKWYAGTPDLFLDIAGKIWIVDFKTSSEVYPEFFYQTSGYQFGAEEMGLFPRSQFGGHIIVHLPRRGGFKIVRRPAKFFQDDLDRFMAARTLYGGIPKDMYPKRSTFETAMAFADARNRAFNRDMDRATFKAFSGKPPKASATSPLRGIEIDHIVHDEAGVVEIKGLKISGTTIIGKEKKGKVLVGGRVKNGWRQAKLR